MTPTRTPTIIVLAGDGSCDGAVTAADVPALLRVLYGSAPPQCVGIDANRDGRIDEDDLSATINALFGALATP